MSAPSAARDEAAVGAHPDAAGAALAVVEARGTYGWKGLLKTYQPPLPVLLSDMDVLDDRHELARPGQAPARVITPGSEHGITVASTTLSSGDFGPEVMTVRILTSSNGRYVGVGNRTANLGRHADITN